MAALQRQTSDTTASARRVARDTLAVATATLAELEAGLTSTYNNNLVSPLLSSTLAAFSLTVT